MAYFLLSFCSMSGVGTTEGERGRYRFLCLLLFYGALLSACHGPNLSVTLRGRYTRNHQPVAQARWQVDLTLRLAARGLRLPPMPTPARGRGQGLRRLPCLSEVLCGWQQQQAGVALSTLAEEPL